MEFFLCVIGMTLIIEGLPYFAFPEQLKIWLTEMLEIPDNILRGMGFCLMMGGLFLVYLGKR
ncbi:MAG: DUF2065 domain-containing protein [Candidatus Magnetomorum sp.]|nr:DUF2065 domain-containing protein [Candidatus Magnetomorum sp.]